MDGPDSIMRTQEFISICIAFVPYIRENYFHSDTKKIGLL